MGAGRRVAIDMCQSARCARRGRRRARQRSPSVQCTARTGVRVAEKAIPFVLSHQLLDETLRNHGIKSNDLTGIDKLFGGADGYYWYHTLRQMCPNKQDVIVWDDEERMRAAVQEHENASAAEDEVKPQELKDSHLAAMVRLLAVRR